jgi:hypothetical protein
LKTGSSNNFGDAPKYRPVPHCGHSFGYFCLTTKQKAQVFLQDVYSSIFDDVVSHHHQIILSFG